MQKMLTAAMDSTPAPPIRRKKIYWMLTSGSSRSLSKQCSSTQVTCPVWLVKCLSGSAVCPAIALPCPALSALPGPFCPLLPCPALPCSAHPCFSMPSPALSCSPCPAHPALAYPVLPCPALCFPVWPYPVLSFPVLPYPVLLAFTLSCPALPSLSCLFSSCPSLFSPALPCPAIPALPCSGHFCPALTATCLPACLHSQRKQCQEQSVLNIHTSVLLVPAASACVLQAPRTLRLLMVAAARGPNALNLLLRGLVNPNPIFSLVLKTCAACCRLERDAVQLV